MDPQNDRRLQSKLCDLADWDDAEFALLGTAIMGTSPDSNFRHRKLWEFTKLVQALQALDLCTPNSIGLSVAAGHERVLYYLARYVRQIIATDVYGDSDFSQHEANSQVLTSGDRYAPYDYPRERLQFLYMNALKLDFPEGLFDFAFCLSSIEHFGGVRNAAQAIREMGRVVKPGGLVFVTTDCTLNGYVTNEVFSRKQIQTLVAENSDLRLLAPISWEVSDGSLQHVLNMRRDDLAVSPHLNLRLFASVFTSISLVLQKPDSCSSGVSDRASLLESEVKRLANTAPVRMPQSSPSPLQRLSRRCFQRLRSVYYRLQEAQWMLQQKGRCR